MPGSRSTRSAGSRPFRTLCLFCLTFSLACVHHVRPSHITAQSQAAGYLESLEAARDDYFSQEKLDLLIETVLNRFGDYCLQCNNSCDKPRAEDIFQTLSTDASMEYLNSEEFGQACTILFSHLSQIAGICQIASNNSTGQLKYESSIDQLRSYSLDGLFNEETLTQIILSFNKTYNPESLVKCFTVEEVYLEANITDHEKNLTNQQLETVSSIVITNLLQGFCIGASNTIQQPEYFIEEVFHLYGDKDGFITEEGFEMMMKDLLIGNITILEEDHDDEDEEEEEDEHDHAKRSVGSEHAKRSAGKFLSARLAREVVEDDNHEEDDESHEEEEEDSHDHDEDEESHQCYSTSELWSIFEVDAAVGLGQDQFLELCPALVQQIASGACLEEHHQDSETITPEPSSDDEYTKAEVYGYGTLAVLIISLLAILGIIVVPLLNKAAYAYLLQFFIALAVGTMAGDALLHLLPEALGLHGHGDEAHLHDDEEEEDLDYLWKSMSMLAAIYGFFVFEKATKVILSTIHSKKQKYDNSVPPPNIHAHDNIAMDQDETDINNFAHPETALEKPSKIYLTENSSRKKQMTSTALLVLLGDGLHNIADGLAIGAAFSSNIIVGISTAIAVFCHELPHELGDFAVLINSGLSYKKALFFNTMSACSAFLGLYIGIILGEIDQARAWIFAVTAGIFLYIALTSLLPEMRQYNKAESNQFLVFFLHNLGILTGITIMFLIAFYEDDIIVGT